MTDPTEVVFVAPSWPEAGHTSESRPAHRSRKRERRFQRRLSRRRAVSRSTATVR